MPWFAATLRSRARDLWSAVVAYPDVLRPAASPIALRKVSPSRVNPA